MTQTRQRRSVFDPSKPILGRRVRRRISLSRWSLWAERIARAFWPLAALVGIFMALALIGIFPLLGPELHQAAVWGSAAAALGLAGWGVWRLRRPSEREAMRRLDTSVPAQPLAALTDRLATDTDDPVATALWASHRLRAQKAAERLRVAPPDLRLASHDRWALRLLAVVLLAGGVIGAGPDWRATFFSAFQPAPAGATTAAVPAREPSVEAWAAPPVYTGMDTVYLTELAGSAAPVELPAGTDLTFRVSDAKGVIAVAGEAFQPAGEVNTLAAGLAEIRGTLAGSGEIEVTADGATLATWKVEMLGDAAPTISLVDMPMGTASGALELAFEAHDDWGVTAAWAEIDAPGIDGGEPGSPLVEPLEFPLPLPLTGTSKDVAETAVRDFTSHPWAGGEVLITLHAEDGAGQAGASGTMTITLPGRSFRHPVARALVEQRRILALRPDRADYVLDAVQAATRRPEAWLDEETQTGAYLAIRIAVRRLAAAIVEERVIEDGADVLELLWQAALELEDGDLAAALQRMRDAEQALRDALERGASEEEIQALMDELRQAMNEYLEEMMRQALENGMDPSDPNQQPGDQQMLSQQDLQDMLQQLEEAMRNGDRETAEQLLSELQRMMENLQAARPQGGGEGQETLEALQGMIQRQRDLADRTFDELRQQRREGQMGGQGQRGERTPGEGNQPGEGEGQGGPGQEGGAGSPGEQPGSGGTGDLAAEQEALRRALEGLRSQLPPGLGDGADEALGDAGRSMGEARDSLGQGDAAEALQNQMDALDRLSESVESLQEALAAQGQGDPTSGQRRGEGPGGGDENRADPFDRPTGTYGSIDGRATEVPDTSAMDRARQLLEELRRRSGETSRPPVEREYLDRLLNPF